MKAVKAYFNTFMVLFMACQMALMPLTVAAAPLTPDGATNTTVTSAQNGVPVVNIAKPSASGLSHNTFSQYNVNQQGLILNNTPNTTVQTQLSGFIMGNPNLGTSASAILNEVTSTNRSALNGYTEVAGPRTDLIIANPNGITINGAGFINTGNLTLTTGAPNVVNGSLNSLNVNGGDITINGTGLDTTTQDSTRLYSQMLNLNAQVHANNLDVKLGNNSVNYPTGTIASSAATTTPTGLLLDSSALGGMYANRITLVGTGAGLGVNLPPEVLASTGNIDITNDGMIALQKMTAAQQINVQSANDINVNNNLYSGTTTSLSAGNAVNVNSGLVASAGSVTVNATTLNNQATMLAGMDANGALNGTGQLNATTGSVVNGGQIQSSGNVNINATGNINNQAGQITATGNNTVAAATIDNTNGTIEAGQNLSLTAGSATLTGSTIYAGNDAAVSLNTLNNVATSSLGAGRNMTINAANGVTNDADLLAGGYMTLNSNGAVTNNKTISSGGAMAISAGSLTNSATGTIAGGGNSTITATGNIDNQSRISSTGNLDVSGSTVTNSGFFNAGSNLTINSANLTNNNTLFAGNDMALYTAGALTNNPNANIFAMNNLTMAADAVGGKTTSITNNQAAIEAYLGSLNISAVDLINRTNAPVVQGTYVPASASIVGGNSSTTTVPNICAGTNCKDVVTTTIDTMALISSSAPATIQAGGNATVNATNITNQYSLISAGGNINLTASVLNNQVIDIFQVKNVSTAMYRNSRVCGGVDAWGVCIGGWSNQMTYVGTSNAAPVVTSTVAAPSSTIQAGGSITGNVAILKNGSITVPASTAQTQNTAVTSPGANTPAIAPPAGNNGLFVLNTNPQSTFLIETNPAFTVYSNFISSGYMVSKLNFAPTMTTKLLGDAFYENKLIRDSIFAQTGRRYLTSVLRDDNAQYQYLMDNALRAQEDLQLIPGVSLTHAQIAALNMDIVWLEEQEVAGQKVLVPVVYIANAQQYRVEGGKIIAGDDINLTVDELNNAGLLQAGRDMNIDAGDSITNSGGTIQSGRDMSLKAENDIRNISAKIKGRNIALVASNGDIINERYTKELLYRGGANTMVGEAGSIEATDSLTLDAANNIAIKGSSLKGDSVALTAEQIDIGTTVAKSRFSGSASGVSLKQESLTNIASSIEGGDISINASNSATVAGSNIAATRNLDVSAKELNVLAVNDYAYEETTTSKKGFLKKSSTTTKKATSTNIGSNLSGNNTSLSTSEGDITVVGSDISAEEQLALNSAGNIAIEAGFDGGMDETHTKKSGFFSGGKFFSKSEDLEGKLTKTAVKATLSGTNVSLNAGKDIALAGVDAMVDETLSATAQNISVANVDNEVKTYSKHEKLDVSLGDVGKMLTRPDKMIQKKDGKVSVTLAKAEYDKAETVTTKTEVVSSDIQAGNIDLVAKAEAAGKEGEVHGDDVESDLDELGLSSTGNINIKGSNLAATEAINLTADGSVSVTEAKNTENTATKEQHGKAELKATVKNEYVQIAYAIKAAKESKDNLQKAKSSYSQYKQDLAKQRGELIKLKADLANGKIGIEQADIDEFQALIDDLAEDDAFYKANMALAAADLATKTLAVVTQMSTAASSSGTYGFSASLELDIDMLEKQFAAYKEQSVASNLNADNININAGATATIRGSNVAANDINIAARDTNILASQDVNTSSESTDHKHLNISVGTSGATSGSVSMDRSNADSSGLTNTNSQLSANNITINTDDHTIIRGANIAAADKLKLTTEHLEIASVQDSQKSKSLSQGFSISGSTDGGVTGGGVNAGNSRSSTREAVLTTLTGGEVDINVEKDTTLRGALVAAVDSEGNDTGKLRLKTETLEVGSVNNTHNSKSMSMGVDVGLSGDSISSVGIDYANDRANSKTKTLGTIGNGTIEVANVDASSTKLLNRDINDNEVDIYNIESHQGLKGTIDTRMLTKEGRTQIAEEIMKSGMIVDTIKQIATDETVGVTDFFSETDKQNKTYEAVKEKIAKDPKLAAELQNPDLTPQQKEQMLNGITDAVMVKLGYKDVSHENVIVADGNDPRAGHYQDGKAYINDANAYMDSTGKLVTVAGHEASHVMDANSDKNYADGSREAYAANYGENLADFTDMALSTNGYDGGMASSNSHTGNSSEQVVANTKTYNSLDKSKGDDFLPLIVLAAGALEIIDKGLTAYDAYQLKNAIEEGRVDDAKAIAAELGIGLATEVVPGNKILIKMKKMLGSSDEAATAVAKVDAPSSNVVSESAGSKGNWNGSLNKPEANTTYQVDTGHTFATDELGRVKKVEGELDLNKMDRNTYQQCKAGNCGNANDEGGHLIASVLGGPGEKINLVPMDANLNRGAWKQMENDWAGALKEGKKVKVNIEPVYSGNNARPDSFKIQYSVDGGRPIYRDFKNSPGGA